MICSKENGFYISQLCDSMIVHYYDYKLDQVSDNNDGYRHATRVLSWNTHSNDIMASNSVKARINFSNNAQSTNNNDNDKQDNIRQQKVGCIFIIL